MELTSLIPPVLADVNAPLSFAPGKDMEAWMRQTFLRDNSKFYNPAHDHLNSASLAVLWTNAANSRQGKRVVGTAELGKPKATMGKWPKARFQFQMLEWFGVDETDFIITLFAPFLAGCSEGEFFATAEHELYHCGQANDEFGCPKFKRDGTPVFAMRGHDVEEFVGIVERYGHVNGAGDTSALVKASRSRPLFTGKAITIYCGTCQ